MRNVCYALILVAFSFISSFAQQDPKGHHVILISVDGFRPEFYLDSNWKAPTIQRLMREGVYAQKVKPVFPTVTYPNHISMITGVLPNKHGIYYNRPPVGNAGRWDVSMIKSPTVFDAVQGAGLSSAALFWPVTIQSSIQYNVPTPLRRTSSFSADVMKNVASPGLWKELEQHAIGKISSSDIENDVYTGKMAAYLIEAYKPSLMAVHLVGMDYAQHKVGLKNQSVAEALTIIDQAIKTIVDAVDRAGITASTTLLVVGDHGFCEVHAALSPNVWLKKKGIYRSASRWKAKFHTASGGSAFLYLKNPEDDRTLRKVRHILESLPDNQKKLFRIIEREELISIGADPDAMLALNPTPGIYLQPNATGKVMTSATGGTHGYFADFPEIMTGFVGWGSGLKPGVVIQQLNIPDIAPMITRLLGVDFVSADGVLQEEMFLQN